ncbi:hypothetical protein C1X05_04435 [Laceyella sacchari]|nr:(2Fe-2S) ferredoxin domain-containing protein [Laceyella tengchongensis]AUS08147.1 hypothetical protein C1X05_04435 [Laceyella sacchari]
MSTWDFSELQHHLLICNGGSCMKRQGEEVTQAIRAEISLLGLDRQIHTSRTRCNGRCQDACVVIAYPQGTWFRDVSPEHAPALLERVRTGEGFEEHISHVLVDGKFVRSEIAPLGKKK